MASGGKILTCGSGRRLVEVEVAAWWLNEKEAGAAPAMAYAAGCTPGVKRDLCTATGRVRTATARVGCDVLH